MTAMAEMSAAIRTTIEQHADKQRTLQALPDDVLHDFALIVGAYAQDLRAEDEARERLRAREGVA